VAAASTAAVVVEAVTPAVAADITNPQPALRLV
jgi:hypothetical protein